MSDEDTSVEVVDEAVTDEVATVDDGEANDETAE